MRTTSVKILKLIDIQPADHVAMVGYFGPLIPRIQKTGCRLDILELRSGLPDTLSPVQGRAPLAACSVALITATAIVTGTIDEVLSGLGNPRAAVVMGPSTFMRPEVFAGTRVTHMGGVRVRNASAVERIVSEGGGTPILKPHMDFETFCLKSPAG